MKIDMVSVYAIEQHPDNPQNGDIDAIAESIKVNGFYQPIVVQLSTKWILAGNHRYQAAIKLGISEIPVVFVDVTKKQAERIMLADNRTNQLAWQDEAQLANLLESVYQTDEGLAGTGYDFEEFSTLMEQIQAPLAPDQVMENADQPEVLVDGHTRGGPHLKYTIIPVTSEDGKVYDLSISKSNDRAITLNDVNMLRKAIGLDPLDATEVAALGVPDWNRR